MASGTANAILGALLGVGLGEGVNALNDNGGINSLRRDSKGQYGNASTTADTLSYADQLMAPPQAAAVPVARRLPPVDSGGAAVNGLMDASAPGDMYFEALPSMGGDMAGHQNPEKFDTTVGDALQMERKAHVYRAISDAARINEILGQRSISRQQARMLIDDYHKKYPKINIPIQPYTSQQATELRNKALLEQHRDEAEAQGFDRNVYSGVDRDGQPIINKLIYQKHFDERQQAIADRASRREALQQEAQRLTEERRDARDTAMKERAQKVQEQLQAKNVHDALIKAAGKPPKAPTEADKLISPTAQKQYETELADYQRKIDFANKQLFESFGYDATGTKQEAAVPAQTSQPVGAGAATPVPAGIQAAHAINTQATVPIINPQEVARKSSLPFIKEEADIKKLNLKPGDKFIGPSGIPRTVPMPKQAAKAGDTLSKFLTDRRQSTPENDTLMAVMTGTVSPEVAMTWHSPEEQQRIQQEMGVVQSALLDYGISPDDSPIQIAEKLNSPKRK